MKPLQLHPWMHTYKFITKLSSYYHDFMKQIEFQEMLQDALFSTVYQPVISLDSNTTVGYEILNRPKNTPRFPSTEYFYEYSGRSQFVANVESFLRDLSLKRYKEQVRESKGHENKWLFLNIQTHILEGPVCYLNEILELLSLYSLSPSQVVFELTENEAVRNERQLKQSITQYQSHGFRFAVDDAGTGYNSLKTLLLVKPEFIKIDKFLIRAIHEHSGKQQLVNMLLEYALSSGSQVIAEGIETIEEMEFLQKIGVQMGQGYFLGKPSSKVMAGHFHSSVFV